MSYQVLARKWRPRNFGELSGQEHVVKALSNALERGRLHHAYLLTGTRGVGKTTIARILAKSLNCETGVTATPCGTCGACTAIDAGRFVDLLELDAASNTGIDNMREILDNARYAPTVGRYKVYLIDEVHMLSKAAFNSMLKTLEEPPEHVKFVLATTDPQKIPVTVLSRCLQFNLKPLAPQVIADRLAFILGEEGIAHDAAGLALIARAAQGSLRDALSLLDQAIAYGGGSVQEAVARAMLGVVDRDYVYRLAEALAAGDGAALLAEADAIGERGLGHGAALDELAALFHRVAVAQVVPAAAEAFDDAERVVALAQRFTPEAVQLAYQIAVSGGADLAIAPDEATGFSMTLLRMLAFEPGANGGMEPPARNRSAGAGDGPASCGSAAAQPGVSRAVAAVAPRPPLPRQGDPDAAAPVRAPRIEPGPAVGGEGVAPTPPGGSRARAEVRAESPADAPPPTAGNLLALPLEPTAWPEFVARLKLTGMAAQLAAQTELKSISGNMLTLALPASHKHLADRSYSDRLKAALDAATGRKLLLAFEVGEATTASLAAREKKERAEARAQNEETFRNEPFVRELLTRFDGRVKPDTIEPVARAAPDSREPRP